MKGKTIVIKPGVPVHISLDCLKSYLAESGKEDRTGIESIIEYTAGFVGRDQEYRVWIRQTKTQIIVDGVLKDDHLRGD